MKIFALFIGIFFCHKIAAMTPAWTIQPNVCIAKSPGDTCQISLHINNMHIPAGLHCLFLDGQPLSCARQGYFPNEISITLKQNALLELKNKHNQSILTQPLSIKYQQLPPMRRRIRAPWSIF